MTTTHTHTHTPGPWAIIADVPGHEIGYRAIVAVEGGELAETICNPSPMGAANAKLIAKTPEMHALLLALHANAGESPEWIRARIEAVIGPAGEETYCKAEVDPVPDHLREAAPDLLAALRGVLASLEWHTQRRGNFGLDYKRQYDARAAIAKATGAS